MKETSEDRNEGREAENCSGAARTGRLAWKVLRYTALAFLILFALVLARCVYLIEAMNPEFRPNFLAKVSVDIEVDGEPVLIERIVECQDFDINGGGEFFEQLGRPVPTRYFPVVRGLGARLKSGGAIMMYTPYLCDHEVVGEGKDAKIKVAPNPSGALTMMAWTKDADDPEVLEIYASETYFQHPEARVKINRVEATHAPPGASADPPGEFSWFAPAQVYYKRPKGLGVAKHKSNHAKRDPSQDYLIAAYFSIPESIWNQDQVLRSSLQTIQDAGSLSGAELSAAFDLVRRRYIAFVDALGPRGRVTWIPGSSRSDAANGPNQNTPRNLVGESYPMQISDDGVHILDIFGVPRLHARAYPLPFPTLGPVNLKYDGTSVGEISLGSPTRNFTFDPHLRRLFVSWSKNIYFEGMPNR